MDLLNISGIYVLYYESQDFQYYVGQSTNIYARFRQHTRKLIKGTHENYKLQALYDKYKTLPSISVIESITNTELLSAQEMFWVSEFNSFHEGMNLTIGGEGVGFGENSPVALYTEQTYIKILEALTNIDNKIVDIAKFLGVSVHVVSNISSGLSHTYLAIKYPELWAQMLNNLNHRISKLYKQQDYIDVVLLLSKGLTLLDASAITEVPYYIVSNISQGKAHIDIEAEYPKEYGIMRGYATLGYRQRKFNSTAYAQVLELLAYTDMPYAEIELHTLVPASIITSISLGTSHKYLEKEYPEAYQLVVYKRGFIDKNCSVVPRLWKHEEQVYVSILESLANTSKKLNIIAKEHNVDEGVVEDISRGSTHKYLSTYYPELYEKMILKKGKRRAGSQTGNPYPSVKDPQGTIYSNIENAKAFALNHGLHQGHFSELLKGRAKSHKGWTVL